MTALVRTFENEVQKIRRGWIWYLVGVFLFGVVPFINYHYIDGVYYNQVLQFQEGIDAHALRTDKDQYCPGETLRVETAFCKTRNTLDIERSMYMINGSITELQVPKNVSELPVGCFPQEGVTLASLHTIPEGKDPGFYYTAGNAQYTIEGDRKRQQDWQTIPYMILPENDCAVE